MSTTEIEIGLDEETQEPEIIEVPVTIREESVDSNCYNFSISKHIITHSLIISFIDHTHTHSQVIGHSHTCHITYHTHSHHSLPNYDIIHDSHSLSMTLSKIQT
jgi:hypothetical protein